MGEAVSLAGSASSQHGDSKAFKELLSELFGAEAVARRGFSKSVEDFKRWLIENALEQTGGNRTEAAKRLGI